MKPLVPPSLLILLLTAPLVPAQPGSTWTELTPDDKAFTILFPAPPDKTTDKIKTATGTIEVTAYALKPDKDRPAYLLSYSEHPGHADKLTPQQRLDKARDGALASTKGKLQGDKKLTLQGHAGRELHIVTQDKQHLHTRIYVVGTRLYQLFVAGPADQVSSKDAARFLDSFKLKGQ